MAAVRQPSLISFPMRRENDSDLAIYEGAAIPFPVARVFTVRSGGGAARGRHAHKLCNQLMICSNGRCEIVCSDGASKQTFVLDAADRGLWVPNGIWAEQRYLEQDTVLMVLCDRPYDENDYIRDYPDFLAFTRTTASLS